MAIFLGLFCFPYAIAKRDNVINQWSEMMKFDFKNIGIYIVGVMLTTLMMAIICVSAVFN